MILFLGNCTACGLPLAVHVEDVYVVDAACVGGCPARHEMIGDRLDLETISRPVIRWEKEPGDDYVSVLQVWEEAQMVRLLRRERFDPAAHLPADFDSPPQEWTWRYKKAVQFILNSSFGAKGEFDA